jgi:aconitate hydratase
MYLGIKAILTKSYARIYRSNLINFGVLPLIFKDPDEFLKIQQGDSLRITNLREGLKVDGLLVIENETRRRSFEVLHGLSRRETEILLAGGSLNYAASSGMKREAPRPRGGALAGQS